MKTTSLLALSLTCASLLLVGCGSSSSDSATTATTLTSGQLIDNYLQNIDYSCADGSTGTTDINGSFNCQTLPVKFKISGLELGEIDTIAKDKQVFPQDLLHVSREDTNNTDVIAMARFLQSCDEDNNSRNGIQIKEEVKDAFQDANITFRSADVDYYATEANVTLIDENDAVAHLKESTEYVANLDEHNNKIPSSVTDALYTPAAQLSQETKDTLSYMGNEERLAYDVYTNLYNYHKERATEIKTLKNIADNSEATHIATVQLLVKKYIPDLSDFNNTDITDVNTTTAYADYNVTQLPSGQYNIQAIQDLYNTLLAKGEASKQDALEVGCMVEVTDITDLDRDIATAQDDNASDIVAAFDFLRNGSYKHYWAFDQSLINMGVANGCCSLGDEYCHPEYPQTTNEKNRDGSGSRQQYQHEKNK
jgi:hypothetical protein